MGAYMIKSISYDQGEIIKNILQLYTKDGVIDCDATYSKGNFYKNTEIEKPKYCFDIKPQFDWVERSDCRKLPFKDSEISSIIFDPPFLATKGESLSTKKGNLMVRRFGNYPNENELHKMFFESMKEFYRVLSNEGILIFKCQDKVSSSMQYFSHIYIYNKAVELGFYPLDLFVLLSKNRVTAKWQAENQKHARKYHSYFWVFQKSKKKVKYAI